MPRKSPKNTSDDPPKPIKRINFIEEDGRMKCKFGSESCLSKKSFALVE